KPYYEAGGAYPVFFLWRSDLVTVLTKNFDEIAKEPVFQRLVKRLLRLALGKLVAHVGARPGGLLELPEEDEMPDELAELEKYASDKEPQSSAVRGVGVSQQQLEQAEADLETDDIIRYESRAIAAGIATEPEGEKSREAGGVVSPRKTLMSQSVLNELKQEQPQSAEGEKPRPGVILLFSLVKHGVEVFARVIQRFSAGHDHRLYTTIVEEVLREFYLDSVGST